MPSQLPEQETALDTSASNDQPEYQPGPAPLAQDDNPTNGETTIENTQQYWEFIPPEGHIASPQSAWHVRCSDEHAPLRWFGLLMGDAGHGTFDSVVASSATRNESYQEQHLPSPELRNYPNHLYLSESTGSLHDQPTSASLPQITVPIAPQSPSTQGLWWSPVKLLDHEIPIFKRFVNRLGLWMDIFDPMKHFSTVVPQIAMCNEGLMKAILGLAARHMSIRPDDSEPAVDRTVAVQYYYETLQYLQEAMKHQSYNRSLELIATVHIVSMYEMIDGTGSGWERHLKGVFWIQRSQGIGAETTGLQGAGWWTWLRQDVWAAFRERRPIYSIHKHVKTYPEMTQYELASRAVYLLAEAVNYSSDKEAKEGENNLRGRIDRADHLWQMIHEWYQNLTIHFRPFPSSREASDGVFKPIWINPSEFGAAVQIANLAKVLICVHKPAPGGLRDCFSRERDLSEAIDTICGIALTIKDEPAMIPSTQCIFASGLYTQNPEKQQAILDLVGKHQDTTGWPVRRLDDELKTEWTNNESTWGR